MQIVSQKREEKTIPAFKEMMGRKKGSIERSSKLIKGELTRSDLQISPAFLMVTTM
jgi:hypothetical protein